ncbi:type 1 glutamine amidotransferase [Massilia forsythiae]|uniref:Type 1 glutamine amidotransferase n=1 Tax=Massilia forsythiae TaxID=2728020 RepID=A0A7Z2ZTZ7_9BURK|nr:type 1 glutamine amidotransferase domain-containing protein [Massilia forsythiae]QJE01899.1 type 1 glutamine amidotransferase [Massilia forsythiae]
MGEPGKLAGKRIAVLAANGFEQAELETPVAALKAAGAQVEVIALRGGRIRGMHVHQSGELLRVDKAVGDARVADYDGLLLPGGFIAPDSLRQSDAARDFVRQVDAAGKPVATLSQAPLLLASIGLLQGRTLSAWPGIRDDLVNAGATWLNQDVVRDGRWLSGRGPQDVAAFTATLVAFFAGEDAAPAQSEGPSDPPQQEPCETPGQPLRWLSAPSVGAMLSLALLGVGVVAANMGRRRRQQGDADGEADAGASTQAASSDPP